MVVIASYNIKLIKEETRSRFHMLATYRKCMPPLQISSNASKTICQETLQIQADQIRSNTGQCEDS